MKQLLRVVIATITVFFLALSLSAQITTSSQWTWMSGDNTAGTTGVYGTKGVAASTNKPGSRDGIRASWMDATGNFWLFGGDGYDNTTTEGNLGDLWKYDPIAKQWTWMNGYKVSDQYGYTDFGVYGTQGVAAAANKPGARSFSVSWTDGAGNFWLFGGTGDDDGTYGFSDELSDLWKYNPTTNQWAWIKGSKVAATSGTYGTQGTAAAANAPGGRQGSSTWTDATGNLWLFGGSGYDSNTPVFPDGLNDLWKYNPTTNLWVWLKGSKTAAASGTYGTKGTAATANTPGGRDQASSASWTDASGNLWLFGGNGYDNTGLFGAMNDMWMYNPTTNKWTWMNGAKVGGNAGTYGTLGTPAAANAPSARYSFSSWKDNSGNFWIFGGMDNNFNYLNDLWEYNPTTNQWAWMGGNGSGVYDQAGIYGTKGTAAAGNLPGSRDEMVSWADASGSLWLFGGEGYDVADFNEDLNDLWKLSPVVLPVTLTNVKAYQVSSNIKVEWTFSQEINMSGYKVEKSANGSNFNEAGSVISTGNHSSFVSYNWLDIHPNNGANYYRIKMIDKDGTVTYSQVVKVVTGGGSIISAYPNPVTGSSLALQFQNQAIGIFNINLINAAGQLVYKTTINSASANSTQTIQLPLVLSKGIYSLQIITPDKSVNNQKLVIN